MKSPYVNYAGLTVREIVLQSYFCHPDWDADTHISYLINDEFFDADIIDGYPVRRWVSDLQRVSR